MNHRPLEGFRILSLAEQYPGPYATMLLADLGAEVILIERPQGGDPTRKFPGLFNSFARNKKSIALDLKSGEGYEKFIELVRTSDVVLEGYRPGVVNRLKISASDLSKVKSDLIYVSISAFGQSGPDAHLVGHDLSIQASSGMVDIKKGTEHHSAIPVLPMADISSAIFAALSVVTALLKRERFGGSEEIDISMQDCLISWMSPFFVPKLNQWDVRPLPPTEPAYGIFLTKDAQQISLSIAGEDSMWEKLCVSLELLDLVKCREDERTTRLEELRIRLRECISRMNSSDLVDLLTKQGIAFAPVKTVDQLLDDPHLKSREIFKIFPSKDRMEAFISQPIKFKTFETEIQRGVPKLGEHNELLLKPKD
jgi:crotonobetainyl-CoA:carnitine CoA-transferase CaiB-like acyl-CoA transferase